MTTVKAIILVSVILATIVFVVFGYREVKKNEKRSFGGSRLINEEQPKLYSFNEIVTSITTPTTV